MRHVLLSVIVSLCVLPVFAAEEQGLQQESLSTQDGYRDRGWGSFVCYDRDQHGNRWWGAGQDAHEARRTAHWYCEQYSRSPSSCYSSSCQRRGYGKGY
jgi:hypothetical protein